MFARAMQIGLTPDQLLDMTLDTFEACSEGYNLHIANQRIIAVEQAYYTAYYDKGKHTKPPHVIGADIMRAMSKQEHSVKADTVDVDEFLRRERAFHEKLAAMEGAVNYSG